MFSNNDDLSFISWRFYARTLSILWALPAFTSHTRNNSINPFRLWFSRRLIVRVICITKWKRSVAGRGARTFDSFHFAKSGWNMQALRKFPHGYWIPALITTVTAGYQLMGSLQTKKHLNQSYWVCLIHHINPGRHIWVVTWVYSNYRKQFIFTVTHSSDCVYISNVIPIFVRLNKYIHIQRHWMQ